MKFTLFTLRSLAGCLCAGLLSACGGGSPDQTPTYTAIVDAGSSGSRIYLYKSMASGHFGTVETLLDYSPSNLTGLSNYANNPSQAGPQEIQPLLDGLSAFLSTQNLSKNQVGVSVLATAGMRALDAPTAAAIYQNVTNTVTSAGYVAQKAETISGQIEGVYAWADVNYLEGTLQAKTSPYGVVEIGGASAQATYASQDDKNGNVSTRTINGVPYSIFSISYLGLGVNSARTEMINNSQPGGDLVNNACFTSGYQFGANPGDPIPAPGVTSLTGVYDYSTCSNLYASVVKEFNVAGTVNVAGFSSTNFLVIGSVAGILNNWGANGQTPAVLAEKVQTYCQGNTWATFLATFENLAPKKFLEPQCASSTYVNEFLYNATGLSLGTSQAQAIADIKGTKPTWTLGYVLLSQFPD